MINENNHEIKLNLKLLNSFSVDLTVIKHRATYYFTSQPPEL